MEKHTLKDKKQLNFTQDLFWHAWEINNDSAQYNLPFEFSIDNNLNIPLFKDALLFYINNANKICGSVFYRENSTVFYRENMRHDFNFTYLELNDMLEYEELKQKFYFKPFDLEQSDVYRFLLAKINNKYYFSAVFHHLVLDTVSYSNFINCVTSYYNSDGDLQDALVDVYRLTNKEEQLLQKQGLSQELQNLIISNFDVPSLFINIYPDKAIESQSKDLTGKSLQFSIELDLFNRLQAFIQDQNTRTTPFRFVFLLFSIMLKMYSNQNGVAINAPFSIRPQFLKYNGGSFVNTLPIALDFSNDLNIAELIKYINNKFKITNKYKSLPAESVIEILKDNNIISKQDFCNVTISESLGLIRKEKFNLNGVNVESLSLECFEPIFDLNICCAVADTLHIQIDYDSNKFSSEFINTLAKQFNILLRNILNNPFQEVSGSLLIDYSPTMNSANGAVPFKLKHHSLIDVFRDTVKKHGNNIALECGTKQISYYELDALSNKLAIYLNNQYYAKNKSYILANAKIGLSLNPGGNLIVCMLAILKTGAAYVPIDPSSPRSRTNMIIADSNIAMLVTDSVIANSDTFNEVSNLIILDSEEVQNELNTIASASSITTTDLNDLAYIIYTSGSTGTPKGVMISHNNILQLFYSASDVFNFTAMDRWSLFHSAAFDFSVWEIWGAFFFGGTLNIVPPQVRSDPEEFYSWLIKNQISVLNITPSLFSKLVETQKFANRGDNANHLKYIIFGGDNLHLDSVRRWSNKFGFNNPELINMYGITETTVHVTYKNLDALDLQCAKSNIGCPLPHLGIVILDNRLQECPINVPGEICVFGSSLALGYLNKPELTAQKFIELLPDQIKSHTQLYGNKLYKSGDLARYKNDGTLEYLGRIDKQIKVRGFRIEVGDIENAINSSERIKEVAVIQDTDNKDKLIAYYVPYDLHGLDAKLEEKQLIKHLEDRLPRYMIPNQFIRLATLPINQNGKLDMNKLQEQASEKLEINKTVIEKLPMKENRSSSLKAIQQTIRETWGEILKSDDFDNDSSFFYVGGNSLLISQMRNKLEKCFSTTINMSALFEHVTINDLASYIYNLQDNQLTSIDQGKSTTDFDSDDIAIIGMSCRLPNINNINDFWRLLIEDGTTIKDYLDQDLIDHNVPIEVLNDPQYVKRASVMENAFQFDADFFGFSEKEAITMDPQHRQFLECAWEALEQSGNIPKSYDGKIGVFGSSGHNHYITNIDTNQNDISKSGLYQNMIGNEKDFLSTKVSYRLNLTGPSLTIQTGCSSSLVAIITACQYLKNDFCDLAIAGGASLFYNYGYLHQQGMIESSDGFCRPFDDNASGTIAGSGVGIVALKKLNRAIKDNDNIYAVIKGSAINNDGMKKISYTAPSIQGQSAVITEALKNANLQSTDIDYIEAHGTGTNLGDPIEMQALSRAYKQNGGYPKEYLVGSVKSNIGHTDTASGVFGVIKSALILNKQVIPATIGFSRLNQEIVKMSIPFKIVTQTTEAIINHIGVSSFGIGGTNAHVILSRPLQTKASNKFSICHSQCSYIIPVSAKNKDSLEKLISLWRGFCDQKDKPDLPNLAYTAQIGREHFAHRGYLLLNGDDAILQVKRERKIQSSTAKQVLVLNEKLDAGKLTLNISNQDYIFAKNTKECLELLENKYSKELLFSNSRLVNFIAQYIAVKNLFSLGWRPDKVIVSGSGTLVYGVISGCFTLEDAIDVAIDQTRLQKITLKTPTLLTNILYSNIKKFSSDDLLLYETWNSMLQYNKFEDNISNSSEERVINLSIESSVHNFEHYILNCIGTLWSSGIDIDWKKLYIDTSNYKKIAAPGYQFVRTEYNLMVQSPTIFRQPKIVKTPDDLSGKNNSTFQILQEIWSEALGLEKQLISPDSDFFKLGGDSLALVDLCSAIKKEFYIDVDLSDLNTQSEFISMANFIEISKCA